MEVSTIVIFIFLGLAMLILITRPFTVLFHELGHAIPAIIMTKQPVAIYIGSYGDPNKSLHFTIGLLEVWFTYNPFSWHSGLCAPAAKSISINKQILYTLTGPLASFVIAGIACYSAFSFDLHGSIKLFLIVFWGSAIFDLFVNLIPSPVPTTLYDGSQIYNDGFQLQRLLYYKRLPGYFEQAVELYNQQKFGQAAASFDKMLNHGLQNEDIYRLAINSLLQVKNYIQANKLSEEFMMQNKMDSDDFVNAGISCSRLDQHDKALALYEKSLELNPHNKYSLNNKGFTLTVLEKFEEAIKVFDKAIEVDNSFAYSYNNRGLAKLKAGQDAAGLEDIQYSLKLDENDSYAYRNLGIYHLDKKEYRKALDLFEKAKKLDKSTHMIDELISRAEKQEK